jgi:hypothetical protein
LYGCETFSIALTEEHRLRVFENMVLSKIFGSNRKEVAGGLRRLHSEENEMGGDVIRIEKMRNAYNILILKT